MENIPQPFKTPNGWHMVKRLEFEPIRDLSDLEIRIKKIKLRKIQELKKPSPSFINQLKVEYNLKRKL